MCVDLIIEFLNIYNEEVVCDVLLFYMREKIVGSVGGRWREVLCVGKYE